MNGRGSGPGGMRYHVQTSLIRNANGMARRPAQVYQDVNTGRMDIVMRLSLDYFARERKISDGEGKDFRKRLLYWARAFHAVVGKRNSGVAWSGEPHCSVGLASGRTAQVLAARLGPPADRSSPKLPLSLFAITDPLIRFHFLLNATENRYYMFGN